RPLRRACHPVGRAWCSPVKGRKVLLSIRSRNCAKCPPGILNSADARNTAGAPSADTHMKNIGYLSFGHWSTAPFSKARSASDALLQAIELAEAAEQLGVDGAYFRVHHFAQQHGSPFPLLAAVGARTSTIEIGTGVIDVRYENPLYMAADAGTAGLIHGGTLQPVVSR